MTPKKVKKRKHIKKSNIVKEIKKTIENCLNHGFKIHAITVGFKTEEELPDYLLSNNKPLVPTYPLGGHYITPDISIKFIRGTLYKPGKNLVNRLYNSLHSEPPNITIKNRFCGTDHEVIAEALLPFLEIENRKLVIRHTRGKRYDHFSICKITIKKYHPNNSYKSIINYILDCIKSSINPNFNAEGIERERLERKCYTNFIKDTRISLNLLISQSPDDYSKKNKD